MGIAAHPPGRKTDIGGHMVDSQAGHCIGRDRTFQRHRIGDIGHRVECTERGFAGEEPTPELPRGSGHGDAGAPACHAPSASVRAAMTATAGVRG